MRNKTAAAAEAEAKASPVASALAIAPNDELALTALAEAGITDDADDGMAEFNPNDFRTPLKQFNLKGKQTPSGEKITQDVWFDSVEETIRPELHLALLEVHKSNLYEVYDAKEQRNRVVCSSFDQQHGVMADSGEQRRCQGCPDAVWKTQADGKRRASCSEVWTVAAFSLDEAKVCAIRFKRTSLDSLRNYLQAYHLGKRPLANGKRGNIPLFAYRVKATLVMHKSGNYALPVLERGPVFAAADLKQLAETSAAVRETLEQRLRAADESEQGGAPDTSFDTDAMDAASDAAAGGERGQRRFIDE